MFRQMLVGSGVLVLVVACTAFGADNSNPSKPQSQASASDNGDKGDKSGKSEAARQVWPEDVLTWQSMQLENGYRQLMNERAGLENERYETGNRWVKIELGAMKRLDADQARDLKTIRDQRARMEKQRRQILSVLNGQNSTSGRTALVRAMLQAAPSDALTNLLRVRVSAIEAQYLHAEPGSVIATTLKRDGMLVAPPRVLAGSAAAADFQSQWRITMDQMLQGDPVSAEQAQQLEAAFREWQAAAEPVLEQCPRLERVQAKQYLLNVSGLVAKVKHSERVEEVVFWINGSGFSGGTLGDLLEFMASHRVTLPYGCEPHLALQQVGVQWVADLDDKIKCLEQNQAKATQASVAHDAALKTVITQQPIGGSTGGKPLPSKAGS